MHNSVHVYLVVNVTTLLLVIIICVHYAAGFIIYMVSSLWVFKYKYEFVLFYRSYWTKWD